MEKEIIKIIEEFGLALVERQHQYSRDETIDDLEHIPAIKRIAETAYQYLKTKGVSLEKSAKVKKDLINHGRELYIADWMTHFDGEDDELPDEEEARRTFNQYLKRK